MKKTKKKKKKRKKEKILNKSVCQGVLPESTILSRSANDEFGFVTKMEISFAS